MIALLEFSRNARIVLMVLVILAAFIVACRFVVEAHASSPYYTRRR